MQTQTQRGANALHSMAAQRRTAPPAMADRRPALDRLRALQAMANSSPGVAQLQAKAALAAVRAGPVQRVIVTQTGTRYRVLGQARAAVVRSLSGVGISRAFLNSRRASDFIERAVQRASNSGRNQTTTEIATALRAILRNQEKRQRKLGILMRNIGRDLRRRTIHGRGNVVTDLQGPDGIHGYVGAAKNYHLTDPRHPDYSKHCAVALNQNQAANCDQYGNSLAYLLHQRGKDASVMANTQIKHTFAVAGAGTLHETFGDPWIGQGGRAEEMSELGADTYENAANPRYPVATTDASGANVDPFLLHFPTPVPQQVIDHAKQGFHDHEADGFGDMYDQSPMRVGGDVSEDESDGEVSDADDMQEEPALQQLD